MQDDPNQALLGLDRTGDRTCNSAWRMTAGSAQLSSNPIRAVLGCLCWPSALGVTCLGASWGILLFPVLSDSLLLVLLAWGFIGWVPGAVSFPRNRL